MATIDPVMVQKAIDQAQAEQDAAEARVDPLAGIVPEPIIGGRKPSPLGYAQRLLVRRVHEECGGEMLEEEAAMLWVYVMWGGNPARLCRLARKPGALMDAAVEFATVTDPADYELMLVHAQREVDRMAEAMSITGPGSPGADTESSAEKNGPSLPTT